jgi:DNA-binding Lrp family transcriptional regulator
MVRAYVLITANPGRALDVVSDLQNQEGVLQADVITGEYDCIAHVEATDVAGIGRLIVDKVQAADGVFKTITCLAIQ